jgi:hypothetical protein
MFHARQRYTVYVEPPVNEFKAYDGTYRTHYAPPDIRLTCRVCDRCTFALGLCWHCQQRAFNLNYRWVGCTHSPDHKRWEISKSSMSCSMSPLAIRHFFNHPLPMLRTLILEDITFGVFPYMSACFTCLWYYNIEEVFDAILWVLQVCKNCLSLSYCLDPGVTC